MSPMDLHGNLGKPKFGCYLLVHQAGRHQCHNLPLASTQGLKKGPHIRDDPVGLTPLPIVFDRLHDSVEHVLIAKRLGQEIDRSSLHGPDAHRDVAMAGHEDNWNVNVRFGQFGLKLQSAQSGQPDVKH